jgi:hypothetical protein
MRHQNPQSPNFSTPFAVGQNFGPILQHYVMGIMGKKKFREAVLMT